MTCAGKGLGLSQGYHGNVSIRVHSLRIYFYEYFQHIVSLYKNSTYAYKDDYHQSFRSPFRRKFGRKLLSYDVTKGEPFHRNSYHQIKCSEARTLGNKEYFRQITSTLKMTLETTTVEMTTAIDNATTGYHASGHSSHPTVILFIFGSLFLGAFIRTVLKKIRLPYTVVLMALGMALGFTSRSVPEFADYTSMANMDPHLILHVFLPILIFESAFAMDAHTFIKSFFQIILLAIPGLLLASVLTAVLAMYVFDYGWGWPEAMMFGSILSATDPVAVVALLKDLGASKQLGIVIEGESLLNDGAAIVVFNVFLGLTLTVEHQTISDIILYFFQVAFGGPAFGFFMGKLTTFWLAHIFNDALTEITITLASTYVTFYVGESVLQVSGVLAVVVLGVVLSAERTSISPEVEAFLHRFWEMLAYLANTLIFILVGVVVSSRAVQDVTGNDWFYLIALYFGINIIRAVTISSFSPLLKRVGYGLNWKNGAIMVWGGLRGAVGLALALLVAQSKDLVGEDKVAKIGVLGSKVLFHTSGIVILTLLVNATTISSLLRILGMSDISGPKRMAMASAVRHLKDTQQRTLGILKTDRFLADADWELVQRLSQVEDPYHTLDEEAALDNLVNYKRTSMCPECSSTVPNEPSPTEFKEMENEARLRMLKAEKVSYWKQFEHGMLSREAVRKLVEGTEVAADIDGAFVDVKEIKKTWSIRGIYPFLKRKLESWILGKGHGIDEPDNILMRIAFRIANHIVFDGIVYVVIMLNLIPIFTEITIDEDILKANKIYFQLTNYLFLAFYIFEATVKILAFRKWYFFSHWNQFDLFVILVSVVDICVDLILKDVSIDFQPGILKAVKVVRLLRMLRLWRPAIPKIIAFLNTRINMLLSFGYDVGKGYVVGEEEVRKLIIHMVDHKQISKAIHRISDQGRLFVTKELGLLQREHPGIAVAVKTRQAIRHVLNNIRDSINELKGDGLLDEMECHKLEQMVEVRMKRLLSAPATIPPPPPSLLLRNVSWLKESFELLHFVTDHARLVNFNHGEVLVKKGRSHAGVFILVSGMVRIEGLNEDRVPRFEDSGDVLEDEMLDYLTAGNVIGEFTLLTGRPRGAHVVCETACTCFFVTHDDMKKGMLMYDSGDLDLEKRIWNICCIRFSTHIMLMQPKFEGWTKDSTRFYLDKGHVLDIQPYQKTADISDYAECFLIQGSAINAGTREEMRGPCYIPSATNKLIFHMDKSDEKIIIYGVPKEQSVIALVDKISCISMTDNARAVVKNSSRCLKHASLQRINIKQKISSTKVGRSRSRLFAGSSTSIKATPEESTQHKLPPINKVAPADKV